MKTPLVSVVLAVYNAERFIAESIQSVLMQTHKNIQLIVIDDGSTDSTADIVRSFSDSRIELYQLPENRHISYATNVGFSKIRGDYVAIIDGDDIWVQNKIEKQLHYLQQHPQHKGCFTWVDLIDENGVTINDKKPELHALFAASTDTQEEWLRFFFFHGNRLNNPSSLVASETIKTIGGHNLFYIQATDMDWWVRFTKKYSFGVIEEPLTKYRRLMNSSSSVSSLSEEHDARFYNELMHIHYHFFDDMDDELFIRAFQCCFERPDSHTPEEIACEKALLMIHGFNGSNIPCALGLLKIEELLSNSVTAELMWSRYHFSTHKCGTYTGLHLYNDLYTQHTTSKLENTINELHNTKNKLLEYEIQLSEIHQLLQHKDSQIHQLEELHSQTAAQLQLTTDTLNTITSSNAWKITAPLRKCKDLFHK